MSLPKIHRIAIVIMLLLISMITIPLIAIHRAHASQPAAVSAQVNPITLENRKPGTRLWDPGHASVSTQDGNDGDGHQKTGQPSRSAASASSSLSNYPDACTNAISVTNSQQHSSICGYTDQTSVNVGGTITFYINSPHPYTMQIYRKGWYGGAGATLLQTIQNLPAQNQTIPTPDPTTGLIAAHWAASYHLHVGTTWTSGAYLALLTEATDTTQSNYVLFVVRNDASTADILFQLPVATYQAYNDFGGKSLYDFNSINGRASKVSFDRPYAEWAGAGYFFFADNNMIEWLESHNYNVTYATSIDTETNPHLLDHHKIFLTDYHDEYWSREMRNTITNALNAGKNLAFFSANSIYWQIRFEASAQGIPDRVIVCYKYGPDGVTSADPDAANPATRTLTTVLWRDPTYVNQPENALLGSSFESLFNGGQDAPWRVTNASHWIYNGTGVQNGDTIAGLVGYEFDAVQSNGVTPKGLVVLSSSRVTDSSGARVTANSSFYVAPSHGMVFDAGTINWAWTLMRDPADETHRADPRVGIMTANILNAMLNGTQPPAHPSYLLPVYNSGLTNGFVNWSWDSTINFSDTADLYNGTTDIAWVSDKGGAGLNFHNANGVDTTGYQSLVFSLQTTQHSVPIWIGLVDQNDQVIQPGVNVGNYGGNPLPGEYTQYVIPLSALGGENQVIKGIQIVNTAASSQPVVYVGEVGIQSNAPLQRYSVYNQGLVNGCANWSWDSTTDFQDTTAPYSGTYDIAWTPNKDQAGLNFNCANGINTANHQFLIFSMQATQSDIPLWVGLVDQNDQVIQPGVGLENYGGSPIAGVYIQYAIPLADLGGANTIIKGIQIVNSSGSAQPPFYVEDVGLQ